MLEVEQSQPGGALSPPEHAIRAHLQRVLASKQFAESERLSELLRFIVDHAIGRRTERLKESVIAVEVFGRETSFDGNSDSIVRNGARRLRLKLAEYYAGEGLKDPVQIEIPKGGYTPVFREQELAVEEAPPSDSHPPRSSRSRLLLYIGLPVAACLLLGIGLRFLYQRPKPQLGFGGVTDPASVRLYSDAVGRLDAFDPAGALSLLEKAIAIEPASPLLHLKLSQVLQSLGYTTRARAEAATAFKLRTHLSQAEQLEITGWFYDVSNDFSRAANAYAELAAIYPAQHDYAIQLSTALRRLGKIDEALAALDRAIRANGGPAADLLVEKAWVLATRGAFEAALPLTTQAATLASRAGLRPVYVDALLLERGLLLNLRRTNDAVQVRQLAETACREMQDPACMLRILRVDGNQAIATGDISGARRTYERGLQLAKKMGSVGEQVNILQGLALLETHAKHPDAAATAYDTAWQLCDESLQTRAVIDRERGDLALSTGNISQAVAFYRRALAQAQTAGDQNEQALIHEDIGDALVLNGESSDAFGNFKSAAALLEQLGSRNVLARVRAKESAVLVELGQLAAAAREQQAVASSNPQFWSSLPEAHLAIAKLFLAENKSVQAASEARAAAALFEHQTRDTDGQILADIVLLRALSREHRQTETLEAASRLQDLSAQSANRAISLQAKLALREVVNR